MPATVDGTHNPKKEAMKDAHMLDQSVLVSAAPADLDEEEPTDEEFSSLRK